MQNGKVVEVQQIELSLKDKIESYVIKNCKTCNLSFNIYEKDTEILDKLSPIFS
jgi:hypothetical protein